MKRCVSERWVVVVGPILAASCSGWLLPRAALAWPNLLRDPGFDRYHFDAGAGYWVPDGNAAWTEFGFGRASVRFDASNWTAPAAMAAERPLNFTPGTTGYEGTGPTQNTGRIILQQDIITLGGTAGQLYEAWVWLGGAGLDDNTGADHKDEAGGWDILFYSEPNPANWTESNAIEYHHAYLDYPGEPNSFVRVSGFGRIPGGAQGMRFRAWASTWYSPAGPANFSTQVAIDNAHFAFIQSPNLLVNGNFEQDLTVGSFQGWTRPAVYPFPKNGQNPVIDVRNTYGDNIDHGTFRPYWGGSRAYGYETYVYGAWIDDAFTFSQVVDLAEGAVKPMTFMFYWLQDTAMQDKRAQLRNHGGQIGTVLEYLDANSQVIGESARVFDWPVASNPVNVCKYDQNAGSAYNPRIDFVPPEGTRKIRVNVNVMMHLLYSPVLSLTSHLVDEFFLGYSQGADQIGGVTVSAVGHTNATVAWSTSNPRPSHIEYGTTTSYGQSVQLANSTTSHQVVLTGLTPGERYFYRIVAGDAEYPASGQASSAYFLTRSHGDFDGDRDIDQADFGMLQHCLTGPGVDSVSEPCLIARIDADGDIDGADVEIFSDCFSGPNVDYDLGCDPGG